MHSSIRFTTRALREGAACAALLALPSLPAAAADAAPTSPASPATTITAQWVPPGVVPCGELPKGHLTDAQLAELVPEGSPGKVRISWRTESQEECYGFNVYRATGDEPDFQKINASIIPGEGSTNVPTDYCVEDRSVTRGAKYRYYIEEISNTGTAQKLTDTLGADGKGIRVTVKTVALERESVRKKALGEAAPKKAPEAAKAEVTSATAAKAEPPARQARPIVTPAPSADPLH